MWYTTLSCQSIQPSVEEHPCSLEEDELEWEGVLSKLLSASLLDERFEFTSSRLKIKKINA